MARSVEDRSSGKSSVSYTTHSPPISNPLSQVHLLSAGRLPDEHNTHIDGVVESHLMHPLTDSKHSLPVTVDDSDFVQAFLSLFSS